MKTSPASLPLIAKPHQKFEPNLEGLRGFAAVIVVFHHIVLPTVNLDPGNPLRGSWLNPLPGHASVLLFFILSGYVIGLTTTNSLTRQTIIPYLRKRLVRLYPIYLISLIFTLALAGYKYSLFTKIGHFLFLQNSIVPLIFENAPLWSLNSEVLYYLAFIPLSYLNLKPGWVSICSLVAGIIFSLVFPAPYLSSYCFGFVFWTSGLWLAQSRPFPRQYASSWFLLALLCLFMGAGFLNPLVTAEAIAETNLHFHFPRPDRPNIHFDDLLEFPFCFYIFSRFTNHIPKWNNHFLFFFISSSTLYYLHIIHKYGFQSDQAYFLLIPAIFFALGIILLLLAFRQGQPDRQNTIPFIFIKLGSISYGIYVIHFPILILLSRITIFSGSQITFVIRTVFYLILVWLASYLLEIKIQPIFKKYLG